jgi:hypothetical protein
MASAYGEVMGIKKIFLVIGALFIFVLFLIAYQKNLSIELSVAISAVTFVYGFFLNSIFGFIQRKFTDFATNMSDLNANLQSLFEMMRLTDQPKLKNRLRAEMVEFVNSLKNHSPMNYDVTQNHISKLFSILKDFKIRTKKDEIAYARIINTMDNISVNRERAELFGDRYFVGEIKFIFLLLTALVSVMIVWLCINNWYLIFFALILVLTLIFTSSLLYNMDRMRYGKMKIRRTNLEELLKIIKKD